ncbi:NUDIX hydrolase [Jeotgalibacillus sp. S-D1]|uniref:NUDIX domain-containing protein n=1 Tax=Jeotgalibacillus sp. S-D1 TaxID=2552189 RepID=UPI0010595A6C|nr:NUDIX hydrolase [Jeotgalibacillus sp. S-D1]TDL30390.1 NUDIX hydrolase [Jeotgalibacillus sp. S-D1]
MSSKRGNVWLAVAGLVKNEKGEWLVVKKKYGGLKGVWSLPAGFVEMGETADQAVRREVLEETGIRTEVEMLIGLRTGVIKSEISDNLIIFALNQTEVNPTLFAQEKEIAEVKWMDPDELMRRQDVSKMIPSMILAGKPAGLTKQALQNPGDHFNYSAYHLFL